jgi:hypothetical protein
MHTTLIFKQETVFLFDAKPFGVKQTKQQHDPVYYVTGINHHASITWFQEDAEHVFSEFSQQTM